MQNHAFKPGLPGHEPLAAGVRHHLSRPAPATRHARGIGVLGSVGLPVQSPRFSRQFLAVQSLPEWDEIRAVMLEMAEAA